MIDFFENGIKMANNENSKMRSSFMDKSIYQLRIYEVSHDKKEAFHDRFKNHALRIMKKYDFHPVAIWESKSVVNFEFIYILKWSNIEIMEKQWKLFLADEEWINIKKNMNDEIGEPVLRVTSRVLEGIEYSPVYSL
jgi:hypothetical protein